MPSTPAKGDAVVDLQSAEFKSPQPKFLVDWDQGPVSVNDKTDYPDYKFNPQEIAPVGDGRDEYPANPVIAWHNWTVRDPSQSLKVPNTGATTIIERALLDQQRGRQAPPLIYPNMLTQSPTDWDDPIQISPADAPNYLTAEAAYMAAAERYGPLDVNVVS
jgi:hypothetical protein